VALQEHRHQQLEQHHQRLEQLAALGGDVPLGDELIEALFERPELLAQRLLS